MSSTTSDHQDSQQQQRTSRSEPGRSVVGYKDAFKQWLWQPSQVDAEDGILNLVQGIPADRTVAHNHTEITVPAAITGGSSSDPPKTYFINEYAITTPPEKEKNVLVMMHGYGAGLSFFFKNFGPLAAGLGSSWSIYALDWLGYGGSSRPKFRVRTSDLSATENVTLPSPINPQKSQVLHENVVTRETEDWFVESLEAWRAAKGIERFTLMGHSMGGYFAAAYAFRYPQRVERLVMVSPAGVERGYDPSLDNETSFRKAFLSKSKEADKTDEPTLQDEVDKPQSDIQHADHDTHHHTLNNKNQPEMEVTEFGERPKGWRSAENRRLRFGPRISYLWNNHYSPFFFIRASTFLGPRLVSYWSYNRFNGLTIAERDAMHTYAYKIMSGSGSGEYAITRILAPGALPRMPLLDRLDSTFGLLKCPSLWMYGQQDWMDVDAGFEAVKALNALDAKVQTAAAAASRNGQQTTPPINRKADYVEIPQAGHHLYLDNPNAFNTVLLRYLLRK
ncbi:uncharacterized protein SAPINGB_P002874 [Magnusiomyces paraingens]|uniref:AB hydrolase-1 domain-containing protein n=1 Tax=Magnusiomyces paraingens TaxID=2606893 RepID=A0A5E8BIC6_9ASCO|nr:uncharacterized protein SAPINGB_P002874 [Saprochaete ingens]VVT50769.1 unnamed protein product [Saprochaete ingens]